MKKNTMPKNGQTSKIQHQKDPIPWRYCFLTVACGLILAAGFFFAARQHFSAIEFGIKNAKLRQQKNELENAQRQLYLAKEVALSPVEIKKAAKKIGLQDFASSGMEVVRNKVETVAASAKKVVDQNLTPGFLSKASLGSQVKASEKDTKDKDAKPKAQDVAADNIRSRVVGK